MTKTQSLVAIPAIAFTLLAGGALAGYATLASADSSTTTPRGATGEKMRMHGGMGGHGRGHGVMGTVSAVNGSTITVTGRDGTSYTVNAGEATVQTMTTGSLSDVQVGEIIGVHGTKDGTTVTATKIMADLPATPTQAQ